MGLDYNAVFYTTKANFASLKIKNCKNDFHKKFWETGNLFGNPDIYMMSGRKMNGGVVQWEIDVEKIAAAVTAGCTTLVMQEPIPQQAK